MDAFIFSDKVVIEFYGNGCLNCQMMEPIMRDLEQTMPNIRFYRVNADLRPDLVQKYQITSLPTLVVFRDGQKTATIVGVKTPRMIRNQIDEALNFA